MAFPVIADSAQNVVTGNSSSWTLSYPPGVAAGDLLLALVATDGAPATATFPAGWVVAFTASGSASKIFYAKKLADGSESGTFGITLSAGEQGAWKTMRITGWEGTIGSSWGNVAGSGAVIAVGVSGTNANPNPPSLDPINWSITEDTMWMGAMAVDTSRTVTAYPSNLPDNQQEHVSGGSNGATLGLATANVAANTFDPLTFTVSASDEWAAVTIAIRPSASGPLQLNRTASDTITTVSDAVGRAITFLRTTADTITSVTDAVAGAKVFIRTVGDTITTVTDGLVRAAANKLRTVTDTTTVSDSIARINNKLRTVADTITTSDAINAVKVLIRTVTDTVTTVTDSIARISNKLRASTDTITTVTDTLVRSAISFARTTSDTAVTASSGNNVVRFPDNGGTPSYSASGQYNGDYQAAYAANGTAAQHGGAGVSWATNGYSVGMWWRVDWNVAQTINRVRLYDRATEGDYFGNGHIEFSNGENVSFTGLPNPNSGWEPEPLDVTFSQRTVTWFRVVSDNSGFGNPGFAEVEAYGIGAVSDAIARVLTIPRLAIDTVTTVSDSLVRNGITFLRNVTDTVVTSDSVVGVRIWLRTAVDTITTVTDAVARALTMVRNTTDTTIVSDSVARMVSGFRTATDTVTTVTDTLIRSALNLVRSMADTTSVTDSVARINNKLRSANDTITTVTDTVVRGAISFARSTIDTVVTSDSVARVADKIRSAADTITTVTDDIAHQVIVGAQQLFRTASDTVTIGADTVGRTVAFVRTLADTTTVSDVVNGGKIFFRSVIDTVVTSDAVTRAVNFIRAVTDTTTVSDSVTRAGLSLIRTVSDATTSVSDVVIRVSTLTRNAMDTLSVSDTVQRVWNGTRQAVDTLPTISDIVTSSAAVFLIRTASDTVNTVTDSVARVLSMGRGAVDTVVTSDTVTRITSLARTIADTIPNVTDTVVRGGIVVRRTVEDSLGAVTDFVHALTGLPRYTGEYIRVLAKQIRFRVGVNDTSDNVHAGPNRVRVTGDNNKERVD